MSIWHFLIFVIQDIRCETIFYCHALTLHERSHSSCQDVMIKVLRQFLYSFISWMKLIIMNKILFSQDYWCTVCKGRCVLAVLCISPPHMLWKIAEQQIVCNSSSARIIIKGTKLRQRRSWWCSFHIARNTSMLYSVNTLGVSICLGYGCWSLTSHRKIDICRLRHHNNLWNNDKISRIQQHLTNRRRIDIFPSFTTKGSQTKYIYRNQCDSIAKYATWTNNLRHDVT